MSHPAQTAVPPLVAISILNWNGWKQTLECLKSVRSLDYAHYLTIVVSPEAREREETEEFLRANVAIGSTMLIRRRRAPWFAACWTATEGSAGSGDGTTAKPCCRTGALPRGRRRPEREDGLELRPAGKKGRSRRPRKVA